MPVRETRGRSNLPRIALNLPKPNHRNTAAAQKLPLFNILLGGKRNSIIVPATGLKDFKRLFDEMVKASDELPPTNSSPGAA